MEWLFDGLLAARDDAEQHITTDPTYFGDESHIEAWIRWTLPNRRKDQYRSTARHAPRVDSLDVWIGDSDDTLIDLVVDTSMSVEDHVLLDLESKHQEHRYAQILSRLSPRDQKVGQLRQAGHDNDQIAHILGQPTTTIAKSVQRTRQRLNIHPIRNRPPTT